MYLKALRVFVLYLIDRHTLILVKIFVGSLIFLTIGFKHTLVFFKDKINSFREVFVL